MTDYSTQQELCTFKNVVYKYFHWGGFKVTQLQWLNYSSKGMFGWNWFLAIAMIIWVSELWSAVVCVGEQGCYHLRQSSLAFVVVDGHLAAGASSGSVNSFIGSDHTANHHHHHRHRKYFHLHPCVCRVFQLVQQWIIFVGRCPAGSHPSPLRVRI